jgi:hypothetical protein
MKPDYPTSVDPIKINGMTDDSFPNSAAIKYSFPAKDNRLAWTHTWHEGGEQPPRPVELAADRKMPISGNLVIGTKGKIFITGDYGDSPRIIPDEKHNEFMATNPPKTFERLTEMATSDPKKKIDAHHADFLRAIVTGKPAGSNFDYAGPFTEIVQLGNVALKAGKKVVVDPKTLKITNLSGMDHLIHREYRKGWEVTSI